MASDVVDLSESARQLLKQALELPEGERQLMADALIAGLETDEPGPSPEFLAELDRRFAEYLADPASASAADDVLASLAGGS